MGLRTQTQNAAFFERKGPKRKPWPRGKSLNRKKMIAMRFLNASVLERKALNRNLSWGFPLGNLPKTRVLKHRVLERKRRPNANASVLGTQRFRTLRSPTMCSQNFTLGENWPNMFPVWKTDSYPVRVLGGIAFSLGGCRAPAQYWIKIMCTHGSRNFIQYWGWGLEEGS